MGFDITRRCVRIIDSATRKALGSGFRLSARKVLTARHVIADRSGFLVLDREFDDWISSPAAVCWRQEDEPPAGQSSLDIALLSTEPVDGLEPWSRFLDHLPVDGEETICHVIGYPGGGLAPEQRETVTVSAYFYPDLKDRVQLKPHGGEPDGLEDWRGLSGSPMLSRDSTHLAGVLSSRHTNFSNRKLFAVPMATLYRIPDFRAELETPDLQSRVQPLLDRGIELLEGGLKDELAMHNDHWKRLCEKGGAKELSKVICFETDLEEQSMALLKALESAVQDGRGEAARRIYEFLRVSLPAAVLQRFDAVPPDSEVAEIRIPAATKILVEIAMAGIDGRPLWVREPIGPTTHDVPHPVLNVSLPEETSIDPQGIQKSKDLVDRLASDLGARNLQGFPGKGVGRALDFIIRLAACQVLPNQDTFFPASHLDDFKSGGKSSPEELRTEVSTIVDEQLAIEAELKRRCYIVVDQGDEEFMREVRRRLPHLGRVYPEPLEDGAGGERRTNRLVQRAFAYRNPPSEQNS